MPTQMESIFSLFTALGNFSKTLAHAQFNLAKIKQAAKELKQSLFAATLVLNQGEALEGGDILNAKDSITRLMKERDWSTGMLNCLHELSGAMPYVDNAIDYLQERLNETQRFANVCENIEKPLHSMVIRAHSEANWATIDSVQLNAFNSSMSKLYVMLVAVTSSSGELVKDSNSIMEILAALMKRVSSFNKKIPTSVKGSNYVQAVITHGKILNTLAKETYALLSSTSTAPLLHPEVLYNHSATKEKYGGGLVGALKQMQYLTGKTPKKTDTSLLLPRY